MRANRSENEVIFNFLPRILLTGVKIRRKTEEKGENLLWKWTKNVVYHALFWAAIPFILLTFSGERTLSFDK